MAEQTVILLHVPHGNYANLARLHPDFPTRRTACVFLVRVARPQDYMASFVWRRKPEYIRGDRFLKRFAPKARSRTHV